MKKTTVLLLLAVLAFAIIPMAKTTDAPNFELPMDVMIYREQLADNLEESMTTESLPEVTPFWVDMVDAEVAEDGEGVYVAVLDTGLLSMWPYFFSEANIAWELGKGFTHDVWWDDGLWFGDLRDDRGFITDDFLGSGHGTHVVSTIVGYRFTTATADFWVRGVAPKATIIPVLVLDYWEVPVPGEPPIRIGGGTDEMVAAGINYVADLDLDGPVIISMSLGGPSPSPMIEDAIDYAIRNDVIVVASAGNAGYAGMGWPGAYPQVISCAMAGWTEQFLGSGWWLNDVTEDLNTRDYWGNNWQLFLDYLSSRPNKDLRQKAWHLDVTAPGAAIVGPYKPEFSYAVSYYYLWGTSMAAPHVSGIAALVLQNYPKTRQEDMEHILKIAAAGLPMASDGSLAIDWPPYMWYFTWFGKDWGSGFLQADSALSVAKD